MPEPEQQHSPEPWDIVVDENSPTAELVDCNGEFILDAICAGDGYCSIEDARRIKACVNLLWGIPTEMIENALRVMDMDDLIDNVVTPQLIEVLRRFPG
jgi:hypothetical protein